MIRRFIHTSAKRCRNQYYFYDLICQQPKAMTPAEKTIIFNTVSAGDSLSAEERMGKVFGSLGSREDNRRQQELKARTIAGVKIPAKPEEPTNCCMSGCINCVWELYKDELEEWRECRTDAKKALLDHPELKWPEDFGPEPDRYTNAASAKELEDDAWKDMPLSIRVFVETEKKLRHRHQVEGMMHNDKQESNHDAMF